MKDHHTKDVTERYVPTLDRGRTTAETLETLPRRNAQVMDLDERIRNDREPYTLHPLLSSYLQQYLLSFSELLRRLENCEMSYRNFREPGENLAALLESFHAKAHNYEVALLVSAIRKIRH
ncbi:hypothetical protein BIW11_02859 [Tropilaelaps mercedesae]|uniref:Uncharacterized protein n=1 Tax=Tropilaelaps mercedesae TaxID=418985 RepID=A0A1V9XW94_9ACAR|nr:hypothetical protein BIW11_02859 [Tropilaelaps mercedesae]